MFWQGTSLEELAEGELEEVQVDRPLRRLSATFDAQRSKSRRLSDAPSSSRIEE